MNNYNKIQKIKEEIILNDKTPTQSINEVTKEKKNGISGNSSSEVVSSYSKGISENMKYDAKFI